ncbi:hypothetical protein Sste5346_008986 [Sporothrix stenoceras]|uniref:Uncharacterized protein n=1 Tax=Sporothrix stenoceras TaxID=5173 RepID=A0ABR3YNB9_9PEZI
MSSSASSSSASASPSVPCDVNLLTTNYDIAQNSADWNVEAQPIDLYIIQTCAPYLPNNCIVYQDPNGVADTPSISWSYTMETVMIGEPYVFTFSGYLTESEFGEVNCAFDTDPDQAYNLPFNGPPEDVWIPVSVPFTPKASETTITCTISFTSVAAISVSNFQYSAVCYNAEPMRRRRAREMLMRGKM